MEVKKYPLAQGSAPSTELSMDRRKEAAAADGDMEMPMSSSEEAIQGSKG